MKKDKQKQYPFYYSFMTVILLSGVVYAGISGINNVVKLISFHNKLKVVEKEYTKADINNKALKVMLERPKSDIADEIKHDKLKMAAPDEIVVNIISAEDEVEEEKADKTSKRSEKAHK